MLYLWRETKAVRERSSSPWTAELCIVRGFLKDETFIIATYRVNSVVVSEKQYLGISWSPYRRGSLFALISGCLSGFASLSTLEMSVVTSSADGTILLFKYFTNIYRRHVLCVFLGIYFGRTSPIWRWWTRCLARAPQRALHLSLKSLFVFPGWCLDNSRFTLSVIDWWNFYCLCSLLMLIYSGNEETLHIFLRSNNGEFQSNQPLDGTRAFYGLLFSMLARCISRPSNYTVGSFLFWSDVLFIMGSVCCSQLFSFPYDILVRNV